MKKLYNGLTTNRVSVECQSLLAGSDVKVKVKTEQISTSTTNWEEHDEFNDAALATGLETTITSSF